ncbi:MAG: hypothetical protein RL417_2583 [Pseudomonadota bacterium]|jgi:uncharacterized protein (DUF58 family)
MLPAVFTPELLQTLELLQIRSRRAFLGTRQGGHVSVKRGHGIEFSDYRKYELGDSPRHIDWGVYARSDRLYVKRFQEEQDLSVLIIVDTSGSMITPAEDRKWEMGRNIALALGYIALMQQDGVSFSAPGHLLTPRLSGARAIHQLGKLVTELQIDGSADFIGGVKQAVNAVRFPGVAIVISDFLMPLEKIQEVFNLLRSRNLDTSAIQVLGANDVEPLKGSGDIVAVDSETGEEVNLNLTPHEREEYAWLLEQHNKKLAEFLASSQINYTRTSADEALGDFIAQNLTRTGLVA